METKTVNTSKLALTYGVVIAIIYIILATVINMFFIDDMIAYYGAKVVGYILLFILLGVFSTTIRKQAGGYLTFKQTFRNVFIMLLVINVLYFIYMYIYMQYIDPNILERVKTATLTFMENREVPEEQLEKTIEKFDEQIAESKTFSLGKNLMNFFGMLIIDSLFGLVVSAITKKDPPVKYELS